MCGKETRLMTHDTYTDVINGEILMHEREREQLAFHHQQCSWGLHLLDHDFFADRRLLVR